MMNTKISSCILWVLSLTLGTLPLLAELKYFPKNKEELLELVKDENIKLDEIDTSRIKDMSFLFCQTQEYQCENSARTRTDFRGIEDWDVSNVKNMGGMFRGATSFNQPLNKWDVSNVEMMAGMFMGATSFNQPLDKWDLSSVSMIIFMFYQAKAFNQNLDSWNIPKRRGGRRISQAMMFEDSGMSKLPIWSKEDWE